MALIQGWPLAADKLLGFYVCVVKYVLHSPMSITGTNQGCQAASYYRSYKMERHITSLGYSGACGPPGALGGIELQPISQKQARSGVPR